MNKRQRKKRQRKASRRFWSLMDDPDLDQFMWPSPVRLSNGLYASVTGPQTVMVSTVQDPNSWDSDSLGCDDVIDVPIRGNCISPSRQTNEGFRGNRGFARCFSGDQSRRDSFPSPYLPDGSENPAYVEIVDWEDNRMLMPHEATCLTTNNA